MPAHRFHRSLLFFPILLAILLSSGCAASAPEPDLDVLVADIDRELVARAAAVPSSAGDPWVSWSSWLDTSAPAVLAARHALVIAEARARVQGVEPSMLELETVGGGSKRETELTLALDLSTLVGAGRSAGRRARARVEVERARAALAAARFAVEHELERALARLAVARELERDLVALQAACAPDVRRIDLLEGRAWLAPDHVDAARTMIHHLGALALETRAEVASARSSLARAAGMPPDVPTLDDEATTGLEASMRRAGQRTARADPSARELLAGLPALALARLELVAAEADVRIASAERWPALELGPKATFTEDDLLWGGILRLELPWPRASGAALEAALGARDAARDALTAALTSAENELAARRVELGATEAALRSHGVEAADATARLLRAARARFGVSADELPGWTSALEQRMRALSARSADLERWLEAAFALSEALGAPPEDPPATAEAASEEHAR